MTTLCRSSCYFFRLTRPACQAQRSNRCLTFSNLLFMRLSLLLFFFFAGLCSALAQKVRFQLTDAGRNPVPGAVLYVVNRADSTQRLNAVADSAGVATVALVSTVAYDLRVTAVGMKTLQQVVRLPNTATGEFVTMRFVLETDTQQLSAVTVTAKKPLLRQEDDKTIVDPTPIADISTNAYELMEKTPGLFLDQDGNIYLTSATPATIYINGREQKMSATDLATLLKSLPPNSIDRMEIMRTPSAKYDASGSGGAVNIILKKGVKLGRTGSVTASANQGRFGNQSVGVNLNDTNGGRTTYLNLNYNRRQTYNQLSTSRELPGGREIAQDAYTRLPGDALFGAYGLGYELSPRRTLNLDGRVTYGHSDSFANNQTQIRQTGDASALLADNSNDLQNRKASLLVAQDISTRYKIDSLGSDWSIDGSYLYMNGDEAQAYQTQFRLPQQTRLLGDGNIDTDRHFAQLQTDLRLKLAHGITFETGVKTAWQFFRSRTNYILETNGQRQTDPFRTNAFDYKEAIHAAYIQASKPLPGSFLLKAGVRAENTNMDGHQRVPRDTMFQVRRTDLFPYVFLSRPVMKIAKFELRGFLIYRRSITRPVYDYLNPFARFIDPYLYETGNPALQPQFTQTVEANVSADDFPILAIGRNYIDNIFQSVLYQDPRNAALTYRTYDNLGRNRETYFRITGGIPPGGRYFGIVSAQYTHTDYTGQYENQPLTFSRGSWRYFTYHQLRIDKRSTFTLNAVYIAKGQEQFYVLSDFGFVNLSLNRLFLNRKLTATLTVSDVFFTNNNNFTLNQGNIVAEGYRQSDSRRVGINLRYNFGLKKREERENMFNIDALERGNR